MTLFRASNQDTPRSLKQKWVLQITNGVEQLHRAGIVWGDMKPENIGIYQNEDAWLIDFGGGYMEGCVPRELAGSIEGDTIGPEKTMELLNA